MRWPRLPFLSRRGLLRARMPSVDVCVACYNVEDYIERCLRSLQAQTYPNFRVLIFNDGSRDRTLEIARRIADDDARFVIVDSEENRGLFAVRVDGFRRINSDYAMMIDGDDSLPAKAIESLVHHARQSGADIVRGAAVHIDKAGHEVPHYALDAQRRGEVQTHTVAGSPFIVRRLGGIWMNLLRTGAFSCEDIAALPRCDLGEDLIINSYLFTHASGICFIPDPVYHYHRRHGSYTVKDDADYDFAMEARAQLAATSILAETSERAAALYVLNGALYFRDTLKRVFAARAADYAAQILACYRQLFSADYIVQHAEEHLSTMPGPPERAREQVAFAEAMYHGKNVV